MDKFTMAVLKLFASRQSLSCKDISAIFNCDVRIVGENISYLCDHQYIRSADNRYDDTYFHFDRRYAITVEGRACLENINNENRRFIIPIVISVISLIISVINIIVLVITR